MKSLESIQRLNELNIFKYVDLRLDTAKDRHGNTEGLAITFLVTEYGMFKSKVAANAGTQSGDAVSSKFAQIMHFYRILRNATYIRTYTKHY